MYKIKKAKNGQFYWVLVAKNHKVILTASEQYTSKKMCEKSIFASKKCIASNFFQFNEHLKGGRTQNFSFSQKVANGEQLGKSEFYTSRAGSLKGMRSVVRNAPDALIKDLTK